MTFPLLGTMTLSGFEHPWYFLLLLVVLGVAALYVAVQIARHRRILRFANLELLESVAPNRRSRWRHLPAILLVLALTLFTVAMAGPTHDVRIARNRDATKTAIDKLQLADRTATGEAVLTALQAIATVGAVIGGGDEPPPARIVLMSDGKETVPSNPDYPKGAYTAARTAKEQGVPISTVSFGTP
jgi:Ca-activated chloride channel family protein